MLCSMLERFESIFRQIVISLFASFALVGCGGGQTQINDHINDTVISNDAIVYDTSITSLAQILAGIFPDDTSGYSAVVQSEVWKTHADSIASLFNKAENKNLKHMRQWAMKELPEGSDTSATLFYAFSGPDFLYANTFFPNIKRYILFGLEPVGLIPVFDDIKYPDDFFKHIRRSLRASLSLNFFITKDMSGDLRVSKYNGVTSILMLYTAYTKHKIIDISYIVVNDKGVIQECQYDSLSKSGFTPGVRLQLIDSIGKTKELIYFSFNAENTMFEKTTVKKYFQSLDGKIYGMLKAASYLMHYDGFMKIRDVFTDKVSTLLTDDTGLKYNTIKTIFSNIQLYGQYSQPIELFKYININDLNAAYETLPAKPIQFTYGYGLGKKLIIARK